MICSSVIFSKIDSDKEGKTTNLAKFVVLPSLSESILEKITEEQIKSASGAIHDNIIRIDGKDGKGWESYSIMDSRRKFGRETWQILLAKRICQVSRPNFLRLSIIE